MKKIALVGTASSGSAAPYNDPSWEIWGVSARADYVTRADKWFEIHRLDGEPHDWTQLWRQKIREFSHDVTELVMLYPEADLAPNVVQYPYERIVSRFGTYFMTSTFAWMMAMAIDELRPLKGKTVKGQIGIWGVDMEYGTEYRQQRAGFRHFIDVARFAGIDVIRLADGGLSFEPVPYPMWTDDPLMNKNARRTTESAEKLKNIERSMKAAEEMIIQNDAVLGELDKMGKKYNTGKRREELEDELHRLHVSVAGLKENIAMLRGQYEEQCWLNDYLQP